MKKIIEPWDEDDEDALAQVPEDDRGGSTKDQSTPEERYHNMDNAQILKTLQRRLFEELLDRVESGTATHQELAIVAKLANDNGLVMGPQTSEEETQDQQREAEGLPEFGKPEYA